MSNNLFSGWKAIPFRTVNLYFSCCGVLDVKPSWKGLHDFVSYDPHSAGKHVA